MLNIGDPAPEFILPDQQRRPIRLAEFRGRKVVLYFYPKDMTPGCTQQACDFRDQHAAFAEADAVVLGISPDPETTHARFAEKHSLPFPLLVDTEHAVSEAYGVWKEKKLYGRTYFGIERTTFLIDEEGRVARIWPKVKVAGHAEAVLAELRK